METFFVFLIFLILYDGQVARSCSPEDVVPLECNGEGVSLTPEMDLASGSQETWWEFILQPGMRFLMHCPSLDLGAGGHLLVEEMDRFGRKLQESSVMPSAKAGGEVFQGAGGEDMLRRIKVTAVSTAGEGSGNWTCTIWAKCTIFHPAQTAQCGNSAKQSLPIQSEANPGPGLPLGHREVWQFEVLPGNQFFVHFDDEFSAGGGRLEVEERWGSSGGELIFRDEDAVARVENRIFSLGGRGDVTDRRPRWVTVTLHGSLDPTNLGAGEPTGNLQVHCCGVCGYPDNITSSVSCMTVTVRHADGTVLCGGALIIGTVLEVPRTCVLRPDGTPYNLAELRVYLGCSPEGDCAQVSAPVGFAKIRHTTTDVACVREEDATSSPTVLLKMRFEKNITITPHTNLPCWRFTCLEEPIEATLAVFNAGAGIQPPDGSASEVALTQVPLVLGNCTSCGGEVSCADLPGPLTEAQCSSLEASDAHPIYVRSRRQPGVYSLRGFYLRDYRGGREGACPTEEVQYADPCRHFGYY